MVTGDDPMTVAVDLDRPHPMRRRRTIGDRARHMLRRLGRIPIVALAAGVAVAVLVGLVGPIAVDAAQGSSDDAAQRLLDDYLGALDRSDMEALARFERYDAAQASTAIVDARIAPDGVAAVECGEVVVLDGSARTQCLVGVDGFAEAREVVFEDEGGWRLVDGLATPVTLVVYGPTPTHLGGIALSADEAIGNEPMWLYPGAYPITTNEGADRLIVDVVRGYAYTRALVPWSYDEEAVEAAATDHILACSAGPNDGCPDVGAVVASDLAAFAQPAYASDADGDVEVSVIVRRIGPDGAPPDAWKVVVQAESEGDGYRYSVP